MLRERYAPMNLFDLVPTLRLVLDPVLTQLDHLLDDDTPFQAVKADLAHRRPDSDRRASVDTSGGHPADAGGQTSVWVEL